MLVRPASSRDADCPGPRRLHFLTVMPSPYQRETFRALNASGALTVSVDYFAETTPDRSWPPARLEPHERVLAGIQLLGQEPSGRFNPAVLRRLRQVDADLVIISDYSIPGAQVAMRWLSATGRSWVYWGEVPGVNARRAAGLWVRRRLQAPLARAAAIVGMGSRAAAAYGTLFPGAPVFDIPYFCDLDPFRRAAEARAPDPDGRVRVLFSGQLIPRKGIDLLMRAFRDALQDAPGLQLRILGDGPLRAALEREADGMAGAVLFLGHREPAALPAAFADADLFVLPSRHDGWGVVLNEALGAGLPIVASDAVGAAHDLVTHGVNGLITPREDTRALRDALLLLAHDPARRRAMAEAARARAANWGLGEAVRRWRALSHALLGDSSAVRPAMEERTS